MTKISRKWTYGGVRRFLRPGMTHSLPAFIQRLQGSSGDLNSHRTCEVSALYYFQDADCIVLLNLYTSHKRQICEINIQHQSTKSNETMIADSRFRLSFFTILPLTFGFHAYVQAIFIIVLNSSLPLAMAGMFLFIY